MSHSADVFYLLLCSNITLNYIHTLAYSRDTKCKTHIIMTCRKSFLIHKVMMDEVNTDCANEQGTSEGVKVVRVETKPVIRKFC